MINAPNLSVLWGQLIAEELARLQCCNVCIASGSRNTPLTLAFAKHPAMHLTSGYDERSLGFCALGHARATGKLAAMIVTSGTAVANLFPAVMEASQEGIPLLVITADRPDYLRHSGDNQTVDHIKLFGDAVRWHVSLPTPSDAVPARSVLSCIDKAVAYAVGVNPGPVHVNIPFDKPLHPTPKAFSSQVLAGLQSWQNSQHPLTQHVAWVPQESNTQLKEIAQLLCGTSNGLVILGSMPCMSQQVKQLLQHLQWPIFADMPSAGRFVKDPCHIAHFDLLLKGCHAFANQYKPDAVLQLGARTVSACLHTFLQERVGAAYVLVQERGLPVDPHFAVTHHVHSSIHAFASSVLQHVPPQTSSSWLQPLQQASEQVGACIQKILDKQELLTEPFVARCVSEHASLKRALFVGNSMPIRDMARFAVATQGFAQVGANRGASGIDGIVSTACGFCQGTQLPTTLVLGDLSFLHDVSGLSLLCHVKQPLTVVLINNQGGGIFAFLPIAQQTQLFERCWQIKHDFQLDKLCQAFGVQHVQANTPHDFEQAYTQALQSKQHVVVQANVQTSHNVQLQKQIEQTVGQEVDLSA